MKYEEMTIEHAPELTGQIKTLRSLEQEGLCSTRNQVSYILRHISPLVLCEVARLLGNEGGAR